METDNQSRPWLDGNGEMLPDHIIQASTKSWSPETWERFLVETVERSSSYQRESLLRPRSYDSKVDATSETIWDCAYTSEGDAVCKTIRRLCRDKLTPRQQQIIRSVYWDGFSERKTAAMMGITRSTVAVQKQRALAKLRKLIERELPQFADDKKSQNAKLSTYLQKQPPTFGSLTEGISQQNSPLESESK